MTRATTAGKSGPTAGKKIMTVFKDRKPSSPQFIEETIEIPVSAQEQTEFGRS